MAKTQSPTSHAALDPLTHFTILPITLVAFGVSIYLLSSDWPLRRMDHAWMIAASLVLILLNMKMRVYSLRVQDRVIRQEERLRLAALLPAHEAARVDELSTRQLIALRFASDKELPGLVRRTLVEGLDSKAIKQNITEWRADYARV